MQTLKRLGPWLLLGPVTGPLAEGIFRNLRAREYWLASLYGVALYVTWFDFAAMTPWLTTQVNQLLG